MQHLINRAEQAQYLTALRDHLEPLSAPLPYPRFAEKPYFDAAASRRVWLGLALFWAGVIIGGVLAW